MIMLKGRKVMDCIHLKACRRYSKILRSKGISIARGCNDTCTAYQSIEDFKYENNFYSKEEVESVMYGANLDGVNGYTDIIIDDYVGR